MEASRPQRKTTTIVSYDDITLEFSKDQYGPDGVVIGMPSGKSVTIPLWAIVEIRDWCANNLPMIAPPEAYRY
jgi:hypothetical protein